MVNPGRRDGGVEPSGDAKATLRHAHGFARLLQAQGDNTK
ncbi:hypothetical protein AZ78_1945 [Lysobacter capsici AZ78]|uniref:Uncharacterized protein n=1 Tax=Lysobacter capsici AZ78 TaxID=1444315 RepID=A0A108U8A8_9GAMM|nr:hypothetical protein AZ78_1945 [Lysobacter capsici AZ78]